MKRARLFGVAAATLLFFGINATAQERVLVTSFDDIVGTWFTVVSPAPRRHFLEFKDGRLYAIAHSVGELNLDPVPGHVGEAWFEGALLFINRTGYTDCINVVGKYEIELLSDGNLKFVEIADPCLERNHFRAEEYEAL